MWRIKLNKKLIPMKMHYFLYTGCLVPIYSFGTAYAVQLGYSIMHIGSIMSFLSILSMLTKPIVGAIVDKFRIKNSIFLVFIFLTGISAFLLAFVPNLSTDTSVELNCNETTTLAKIYLNSRKKFAFCDQIRLIQNKGEMCKLNCNNNELLFSNMFIYGNRTNNYISLSVPSENTTNVELGHNNLSVILQIYEFNLSKRTQHFYDFQVKLNDSQLTSLHCHQPTTMSCQLVCSSQTIMELVTKPKIKESILLMTQFWQFFSLLCMFWISQSVIWAIQEPICFDLLGDKPNDYGKQRCWASIGWGLVSILSGWLVDYFSYHEVHKNYTPIFYLVLSFMILNLVFAFNINVVETKVSKNMCHNVFQLLTKFHVISFLLWIVLMGVYNATTLNYLFLYIDDVASQHECGQQAWTKTLQGMSQCVQSFGGEMPLFFCSGWIINKIGNENCMFFVLLAYTIRFFFYSIMTNPIWVLLIELFYGMVYALGRAVMISYSRIISPPSTNSTILGLVGFFDCIGLSLGSSLSGYVYNEYGGVFMFQLFTFASAIMCGLHIILNCFNKDK